MYRKSSWTALQFSKQQQMFACIAILFLSGDAGLLLYLMHEWVGYFFIFEFLSEFSFFFTLGWSLPHFIGELYSVFRSVTETLNKCFVQLFSWVFALSYSPWDILPRSLPGGSRHHLQTPVCRRLGKYTWEIEPNTVYKYDKHIGQLRQIHLTTMTNTRSSAEGQSAPVADLHFQTLFCSSQDLPSLYSFKLPRVQEKQKLSDILYNCTAANRNLKKYFAKYILRHFSNYANYAFP